MKKPLTEEERKLIIKMAATQLLGMVKTDNSCKTKQIKKHIIEALYLLGITQTDMYDMGDIQWKIREETSKAGTALMYRGWR